MSLLVLASADLGYRSPTTNDLIVLVQPRTPRPARSIANTVITNWETLGPSTVTARTLATSGPSITLDGADLFTGLQPSPTLAELVREHTGHTTTGLVPILWAHRTGTKWAVYARSRHHAEDALFLHLINFPAPADPEDMTWLPGALTDLRSHVGFLTSHETTYHKHRPGIEIEHKITLKPSTPLTTVWDLAATVDQHIANGHLPGFTHRYRDPFQTWDFANHLFHITAPDAERGYISFIPTTTGVDR